MKLSKEDMSIVTVSASGTKRQLINTSLRARGYTEVSGVPDFKTVVDLLETSTINWLICPIGAGEAINALQVMDYVTKNPKIMDLRVSLIISEDDISHLGKAFDLGLLSYHIGLEAKDHVENAFMELFELFDLYDGKQDLVSAFYVRRYLKETRQIEKLAMFEKKLLKLNPGQADLLASMAESYYLSGRHAEAISLWQQALAVNPSLEEKVSASKAACGLDGSQDAEGTATEAINVLGIERCIVIDPGKEDLNKIDSYLSELGVPDIKLFANPDSVFDFLKSKQKVDIIIFEWSFNNMAGPILVQKLRDHVGTSIPLTVVNKDLTNADMPILREMGVTDRIKKPLEKEKFIQDVIWVINQDRFPTEPFMIMQKLLEAIKEKDNEKIASLKKKYLDHDAVGEAEEHYVESLIAYHSGCYLAAKEAALTSLKTGGHSLDVLNLLGKSMMKLREFDAALRCLENAQLMCPQNIERICRIAEAHLENGDDEKFTQSMNQAKDLDSDLTVVKETEVKGALKHHNADLTKSLMSQLDSLEEIVSYTNNRAVSLIRTQAFESGIRLYQDAFDSVPEDRDVIRAVLAYNLSLGYIRTGSLDKALDLLKKVSADSSSPLGKKILSLKSRVSKSVKSGEEFKLQPPKEDSLEDQKEKLEELSRKGIELLDSLKIGPGDICCHKIYIEDTIPDETKALLSKELDIKRRSGGKNAKKAS